ncbi:MAG: M48 family metalloprotease [Dyadobacter fermentans]
MYGQPRVLPETSYKYQTVKRTLEKIATTFGDAKPVPHLVMNSGTTSNRVAQYSNVPRSEIAFDEKLYNLCASFGTDSLNAIAFILGHELAHYYLKHEEWAGFAQMLARVQIQPTRVKQAQELEMVADRQGLMHAFAAGYEPFGLPAELYRRIYQLYDFRDDLKGYPTKEERIKNATTDNLSTQRYATAFEIGKLFFLTGKYAEATQCFGHVSNLLPSKEIFLNLGVSELKQAMQYVKLAEMPFALPFELENYNRLNSVRRTENTAAVGNHLKLAEKYLNNAVQIAPTYLKAHVNLAICELLMKRPGTAVETLQAARGEAGWSANAQLTLAVATLYNGDQKDASRLLSQVADGYQKAYNDAVFKKFGPTISRKILPSDTEARNLYEQYFQTLPANPTAKVKRPTELPAQKDFFTLPVFSRTLTVQVRPGARSTTTYLIEASGKPFCDFYVGAPGDAPPAGLAIEPGDTPAMITTKLGVPPDPVMYDEQHAYLVYQPAGLILQVEKERIVRYIHFLDYGR